MADFLIRTPLEAAQCGFNYTLRGPISPGKQVSRLLAGQRWVGGTLNVTFSIRKNISRFNYHFTPVIISVKPLRRSRVTASKIKLLVRWDRQTIVENVIRAKYSVLINCQLLIIWMTTRNKFKKHDNFTLDRFYFRQSFGELSIIY